MILAKATVASRPRSWSAACWLLGALTSAPALAEKTDVVVLRNGDRLTGEVQQLSYGKLEYKTDDLGTVYIEWDKIASLTTRQQLQLELADGSRLLGQAPSAPTEGGSLALVQTGDAAPRSVPMDAVVRVYTVESGKWYRRLEGDVSFGFSFTESTDVEVLDFGASVGSRNERRRWNVDLDYQRTTQAAAPTTERASLISTLERYMPRNFYREGTFSLSTDQELGIDSRTLVGGTLGRYLRRSQYTEWRAGAGLAVQSENLTDGTRQESIEGVLTTTFGIFRFDSPKTDLDLTLTALPSLTESGRWRGQGNLDLRKEIVTDLFFEISLWSVYDNQPVAGASSSDWGIVTSLGYSF